MASNPLFASKGMLLCCDLCNTTVGAWYFKPCATENDQTKSDDAHKANFLGCEEAASEKSAEINRPHTEEGCDRHAHTNGACNGNGREHSQEQQIVRPSTESSAASQLHSHVNGTNGSYPIHEKADSAGKNTADDTHADQDGKESSSGEEERGPAVIQKELLDDPQNENQSKSNPTETSSTRDASAVMNSDEGDEHPEFDPLREHRWFCPWIYADEGFCGWRHTLRALIAGNSGASDESAIATQVGPIPSRFWRHSSLTPHC